MSAKTLLFDELVSPEFARVLAAVRLGERLRECGFRTGSLNRGLNGPA